MTNDQDKILCRGGRTGTKVHKATSLNSSTTYCGIRLRAQARHFLVGYDTTTVRTAVAKRLCEKCFGPSPTIDIDAAVARINALRGDA